MLTERKTAQCHYFKDGYDQYQGIYTVYHSNGRVWEQYEMVDNKVNGLFQEWYESGAIGWQIQMHNGKRHGERKAFTENGSLYIHKWIEHGKEVLNFLAGDKYPSTEEDRLIFKQKYQGEFIPNLT